MTRLRVSLEFAPRDYVTITMLGVNYPGRVNRVFVDDPQGLPSELLYEVQFVDDRAELKMLTFRGDELKLAQPPASVGFTA